MAEEFTGALYQVSLVHALAGEAYLDFYNRELGKGSNSRIPPSTLNPETIHRTSFCVDINEILIGKLKDNGYFPKRRKYIGDDEYDYHEFLDLGNDWLADSTWQQFLPGEPNSLFRRLLHLRASKLSTPPKVLIVRGNELPATLTNYGIKPHQIKYWTEAVLTK